MQPHSPSPGPDLALLLAVGRLLDDWQQKALIDAATRDRLAADVALRCSSWPFTPPSTLAEPSLPAVASPGPIAASPEQVARVDSIVPALEPAVTLTAPLENPESPPILPSIAAPVEQLSLKRPPEARHQGAEELQVDIIEAEESPAVTETDLLGKIGSRELAILSSESVLWFTGVLLVLSGSLYFTHTSWPFWSEVTRGLVSSVGLGVYGLGFAGLASLVQRRGSLVAGRILGSVAALLMPISGLALAHALGSSHSMTTLGIAGGAALVATLGASIGFRAISGGSVTLVPYWVLLTTFFGMALPTRGQSLVTLASFTIPATFAAAWSFGRLDRLRSELLKGAFQLGLAAVGTYGLVLSWTLLRASGAPYPIHFLGIPLAAFALASTWTQATPSHDRSILGILGAAIAVPLVLTGPLTSIDARVFALVTSLLATGTFLRISLRKDLRLPMALGATSGMMAYFFIPAPFQAVLTYALGAVKEAFGYQDRPLPLAYYALTFLPYLALVTYAAKKWVYSTSLRKTLELWLVIVSLLTAGLSLLAVDDPRPALFALPIYGASYLLFARVKQLPALASIALVLFSLAVRAGAGPQAPLCLGVLALIWPVLSRRVAHVARRRVAFDSAVLAGVAALLAVMAGGTAGAVATFVAATSAAHAASYQRSEGRAAEAFVLLIIASMMPTSLPFESGLVLATFSLVSLVLGAHYSDKGGLGRMFGRVALHGAPVAAVIAAVMAYTSEASFGIALIPAATLTLAPWLTGVAFWFLAAIPTLAIAFTPVLGADVAWLAVAMGAGLFSRGLGLYGASPAKKYVKALARSSFLALGIGAFACFEHGFDVFASHLGILALVAVFMATGVRFLWWVAVLGANGWILRDVCVGLDLREQGFLIALAAGAALSVLGMQALRTPSSLRWFVVPPSCRPFGFWAGLTIVIAGLLLAFEHDVWMWALPMLGVAVLLASSVEGRHTRSLTGGMEAAFGVACLAIALDRVPAGLAVGGLILFVLSVASVPRRNAHRFVGTLAFIGALAAAREAFFGFEAPIVLTLLLGASLAAFSRDKNVGRATIGSATLLAAIGSWGVSGASAAGSTGEWLGNLPVLAASALLGTIVLDVVRPYGSSEIRKRLREISQAMLFPIFGLCVVDSVQHLSSGWVHTLSYPVALGVLVLSLRAAMRTGKPAFAFLAEAVLVTIWAKLRSKGLFADSPNADAIMMLISAFAASFVHAWTRRSEKARAFATAARVSALVLPGLAVLVAGPEATFEDAGLAMVSSLVYVGIGAFHVSRWAGPLAAIMLNVATTLIYARVDIVTPQAHALPLAGSILVLAHIYRDVLSERAAAWIRLLALGGAYLSGFVTLLAFDAPTEALIMAVVCVTGVGIGALFRIKSYLFLGAGFLVANLATNIVRFGLSGQTRATIVLTGLGLFVLGCMVLWSLHRDALEARLAAFRADLALWST